MNKKWIKSLIAMLVVSALVVVFWGTRDTQYSEVVAAYPDKGITESQLQERVRTLSTSTSSDTGSQGIDTQHQEDVRIGLSALFESLKQKGILREVPPISKQLKDAIEAKDSATVRQAFQDAVYSPSSRMSEAIPAITVYLGSPDPFVRYLAAEALLRCGDQSGIQTLLNLIQSDGFVPPGETDLRFTAAELLASFNIDSAAGSIRDLYSKTQEAELLRSLASLGVQAAEAGNWKYVPSSLAIENYAKEGSTRFVPQIAETFEQTSDLSVKSAAAWALAQMTGADQYVRYLSEAARPAMERTEKRSLSYDSSTMALKYLGSLRSSQVNRVLEQALESQNPVAVQYAAVNLLFNQPDGSQKAEQVVLRELQSSPRVLGTELTMQIASKLDNPNIRAAAESYAERTDSDLWRYWGVERSNWPVQNWIYDYVVTWNPSTLRNQ